MTSNDFIVVLQLIAGICGACSTAVIAVCTVLNNRLAAQQKAIAEQHAATAANIAENVQTIQADLSDGPGSSARPH